MTATHMTATADTEVNIKGATADDSHVTASISRMQAYLSGAGMKAYAQPTSWDTAICAMVLSIEPQCSMNRLLQALPRWQEAGGLSQVLNTMAHLGYMAKAVTTHMEDIDTRLFPALYVGADGIPVVITRAAADGFHVIKNGSDIVMPRGAQTKMSGMLYAFEHIDRHRQATSGFMRQASRHSWFTALFSRHMPTLRVIIVAELFINLISLTTPLFIMLVYGDILPSGSLATLPMIALGMVLCVAAEGVFLHLRARALGWVTTRTDYLVACRMFAQLMGLSPELIENASVSSQMARIRTFETIRDIFSGPVLLSVIEAPFVVLSIVVIYIVAGNLALVPVLAIGVYAALFYFTLRYVRTSIRLAARSSSLTQQYMIETFEKVRAIRGYGLTEAWYKKFRDLSGREIMHNFRLGWIGIVAENIAHGVTLMTAVLTVVAGVNLIWSDQMMPAALVATMILLWRVLTPFYNLCTAVPRLEQLRQSIVQVNSLMDIRPEGAETAHSKKLVITRGEVEVKNVSLGRGDGHSPTLAPVTFTVKAGQIALVRGESGAGKSSLLYILKGIYTASQGAIRIDGFDTRQVSPVELRQQVAYVPQQADCFTGSVRENLLLANPLASTEQIIFALTQADAINDIQALPRGIDTILRRDEILALGRDMPHKLSLARAYLHPGKLLLIDELPNSLLSGRACKGLREYLAAAKGRKTVIIVSDHEDIRKIADIDITLRSADAVPDEINPERGRITREVA